MLFIIENDGNLREITHIPNEVEYWDWRDQLADDARASIVAELNEWVAGEEIDCASWIPQADWTGTPFFPIWEACWCDVRSARKFFGLTLWKIMMDRSDKWLIAPYEQVDEMVYQRISQ